MSIKEAGAEGLFHREALKPLTPWRVRLDVTRRRRPRENFTAFKIASGFNLSEPQRMQTIARHMQSQCVYARKILLA
jgi:hypothetical protein